MKSMRICADGVGTSRIESLSLPFMFFGPTATASDSAAMPSAELAFAYESVRLLRNFEADRARQLLFVVSGSLEVGAAYMDAKLSRGDVLFVDGSDSKFEIRATTDFRAVRLDVAPAWSPQGIVPPAIHEGREDVPALVEHMYVEDEQARFGNADVLFHDSAPRPVERAMFMCLSPDQFGDWHTESATSLVVVLAGGFELEVGGGGGSVQVFRAGDVCLVQDHAGQGHISRTHGETRFVAIAVPKEHVWATR